MLVELFIFFGCMLLVAYAAIFFLYAQWFSKQPSFTINKNLSPQTWFSIIIPARNEAEHISQIIETSLQQNYPKHLFEVIVIDDFSEDQTANIVLNYAKQKTSLHLIKMVDVFGTEKINSYKKKAIEIGIQKAKGNWIVCTDADCIVNQNWLLTLDNYIQQNKKIFVAAPVQFSKIDGWFNLFQRIDFATLQAITAATTNNNFHTLCNGANMAYSKEAYLAVNGFKGIDDVASGDDLLLLQKIKKQCKSGVGYLLHTNVVVETHAMTTVKQFLNQRIRWASKSKRYTDANMLLVLVIAFLLNLNLLMSLVGTWFYHSLAIYFLAMLLLKTIAEWQLIKKAKHFFVQTNFITFLLLQPAHMVYVCLAAWLSFFGKYTWKDRRVK